MSESNHSTNLTIQAVKSVGYFTSLFQTAGRIVVSGLALIFVVGTGSLTYSKFYNGQGIEGLFTGNIDVGGRKNYVKVTGDQSSDKRFLVLDLSGVILGTPPYPVQDSYFYTMYNVTFGYQLRDQILAAAKDETIAGLFIHTRTPGGTIFGSKAIHEGISTYKETTGKPVVVWVEGMSASGGVYSTASADAIYAAPGSSVGSIGVIGGSQVFYNKPIAFQSGLFASGVVTEEGIEVSYLHAGRGKDFGNPFRRITDEELSIRQSDLDRSYEEFVSHVAKGRGMEASKIVNELGAHLYGNEQAAFHGLIDATLSREEAYRALAKLAGVEDENYQIVRRAPPRQSLLQEVLSEEGTKASLLTQVGTRIESEKCNAANQMSLVFHGPVDQICGLRK
jgi:protease IV